MYSLIVKFTPKQEKISYFESILHEVSELTQKEKGCHIYVMHKAIEGDKIVFYAYESFKSKDDFDFHCEQEYIKNLFKVFETTLIQPVDVIELTHI